MSDLASKADVSANIVKSIYNLKLDFLGSLIVRTSCNANIVPLPTMNPLAPKYPL